MKTLYSITIALALVAGCSKSKDKDGSGATAAKSEDKPTEAEKPAGPLKMSASELWADYSKLDGMAVLDKYGKSNVTITGKIKRIAGEEASPTGVWLDVDGQKWLDLGFTDASALAAKKPKVGDEITATCKVAGQADNFMQLIDCTL